MILRYAVVPALALLAVSCGKQEASPVAETPAEPQSVLVAKATRESLSGSITLTGEFIPYQDVDVLAKVTGYVREVRVAWMWGTV
jgi:multidrug efflux pump subunit AcrA (membrane-fusion protein)